MVRGKKFFTIGSIIAMALMLFSLMFGFTEDGYDYYYSRYSGYHYYYHSFAQYDPTFYWIFFSVIMTYIALGVVAIVLYNKGIKAINIVNLIWTASVYTFVSVVAIYAFEFGNATFGYMLLFVAVSTAFPLHLVAEILALVLPKKKVAVQVAQPVVVSAPQTPVASDNAIAMLKKLKELYDAGILSEEEYNAKKQQYVDKI